MGDHDTKPPGTKARRYVDKADKVVEEKRHDYAIGTPVAPKYEEDDDIQTAVPEGNQDFSDRVRKT